MVAALRTLRHPKPKQDLRNVYVTFKWSFLQEQKTQSAQKSRVRGVAGGRGACCGAAWHSGGCIC